MNLIVYISVAVVLALAADGSGERNNKVWVVHIKGGEEIAKGVARDVGLTYKDKGIGDFKDHYVMSHEEHLEVDVDDVTRSLVDHQNVLWARQPAFTDQSMYHLAKRDDQTFNDAKEQADLNEFLKTIKYTSEFEHCQTGTFSCNEFPSNILTYLKHLGQMDVKRLGTISTDPASTSTLSTYEGPTRHLSQDRKQLSAYAVRFSDPLWRSQWYVQDYRTTNYPVMDHNVVPLYFKDLSHLNQELTGSSVTVGVLGDGVRAHTDLGDNYVESISFNLCSGLKGSLPSSTFYRGYGGAYDIYDTIGTSNAGIIAMKANNGFCGVGIAPNAKIAGIKMIGCGVSPWNTVDRALKCNLNDIDIYCNTWTSDDEYGKTVVGLSSSGESSFKLGTSEGRRRKGAIYVFPSGPNRQHNNCAANGYVNNPYVITIASAASDGKYALSSERCTAVFAAAYSGDSYAGNEAISTISADGGCITHPPDKPVGPAVAAGIFALVLQYKPSLTYRDMMHLIAMTAEVAPLANNKDSWHRNGRGIWASSDFGFGLLNAKNMVVLAKDWQTVPEKHICVLSETFKHPMYFDDYYSHTVTFDGTECNEGDKKINYVEHVELISTIDYTYRGMVLLDITSPAKTNTTMLEARLKDFYTYGMRDWNIMSVHNWGENPHGPWVVTVKAARIGEPYSPEGYIHKLTLKLHGTEQMPAHYKQPRKYAAFRLPDGSTSAFM